MTWANSATYIKWAFDFEDELDGYDPLGGIKITGEEGSIEEPCTYIDAFLEALVEGVATLSTQQIVFVDLIVEPDNIEFNYSGEFLTVRYGAQTTTIYELMKFKGDLKSAVKLFVEEIDRLTTKNGQKQRQISLLRHYIQSNLESNQ